MKIENLKCPLCVIDSKRLETELDSNDVLKPIRIAFRDSYIAGNITNYNTFEYSCRYMHNTDFTFDNFSHELLFESGLHALKDNYYREAVTSFASSLERFYEFILHLIFLKNDRKDFEITWKNIAAQSERQLGAFIILYKFHFHEETPKLEQNEIKFRNDVIHKGVFPNYDDTLNFANKIILIIRKVLDKFKDSLDEIKDIKETLFQNNISKLKLKTPKGIEIYRERISYNTFINELVITSGKYPDKNLELKTEIEVEIGRCQIS